MATLLLRKGKERRIRAGHPWIYASEVVCIKGAFEDGDVLAVRDHKGRFLGRAYVNRRSEIVARMLTDRKEAIDEGFFRRRIEAAIAYRKVVVHDTDAYRVIFSEGDFMPGLIVDRYGPYLVVQFLTLGMEKHKETIIQCLDDLLRPEGIYERSDAIVRQYEGLPLSKGFLKGSFDTQVHIREHTFEFATDIAHGQKTGLFLDQRENRYAIRELISDGKVLDCFCYHGGFAIHAAGFGASEVVGIDLSEEATAAAHRNAELNSVSERCRFEVGNVFDRLRVYEETHTRFDLVILDPPSFTKSRDAVGSAIRGYKEINLRAMKILTSGGYLVTCSCSYHVTERMFRNVILEAAKDVRRKIRLVERRTQARDHPVLWAAPETQYLKCLVLQIM